VKSHCLPFSRIPHTTRLFTDFLAYSPEIRSFYPRSPYFNEWMNEESKKIAYDPSRREDVAAILERQNKSWDGSAKTLTNLDRLRKGASAIVTGQQVGLFGGPMFSIYKALTAVKLAAEATAVGVESVPIFWLATYDHDLAEVNHVLLPGTDGTLRTLTTPSAAVSSAPVSAVRLGKEILPVVEQAAGLLQDTEATTLLRESYRLGETLGTAFARLYARLFADWGVIVLDASDPELHRIAKPIYVKAVERAREISEHLEARGRALDAGGYHQQVKVGPSAAFLFMLRDGVRKAIHYHGENQGEEFSIETAEKAERLSRVELRDLIRSAPEQFNPNVLLRPAIEDYLLPTLAYTGGAAEAAYFAQAGAVYEILLGRVTPIVPRFSATIVEPKIQRLIERHAIGLQDAFNGVEALRQQLAAHRLPQDLQAAFEAAQQSFDLNLSSIKQKLEDLDRTLVDAAETSRSKMQHQLEKLRSQAARAEAQRGEMISRHAENLSQALYPEKGLQERSIGGIYFLARYGRELLDQLYETIQSGCLDHQILEI
jgi:bacillithiol synthase